jgi:WD40 repeat protein
VTVLAPILASLALAAPGQPAEVAFVSRDGVYGMRADGSERRLLIAGAISDPAWSPDGRRLAYAQGDQVRVDGRVVTHPPGGVSDASPAWSPDGGTLAFARYALRGERDLRTEIVLLTVATAQERVLVEQPIDARLSSVAEPRFSPDGTTVAYTRHRLGRDSRFGSDVLTIPVAGGPRRTLLRAARSAVWSPDGTRLAYSSIRDRNGSSCGSDECEYLGELYVAGADGSNERRLTDNPGFDGTPAWAPDGSRILFSSDQNLPGEDALEVYSVAPDGSCLTWITNGTPASAAPSWRPGSGDSFAPGSCDPAALLPSVDVPAPKPFPGGLWLGPRHRGLLLSDTIRAGEPRYADCERFNAADCPPSIRLTSVRACRDSLSWGSLEAVGHRFVRRHGALVAFTGARTDARVLSGAAITSIGFGRRGTRRAVLDVVADLRPYARDTAPPRLAAPHVPRTVAARLNRTARLARRLGRAGAARQLHIEEARVRTRLQLRSALRPYRLC